MEESSRDDFCNSNTSVLVNCMHCGKQHPTPIKNWLVVQYITNNSCTFCGFPLAKIQISFYTESSKN